MSGASDSKRWRARHKEREREKSRQRMAAKRANPEYRKKTVEQVREIRRKRRLDKELEHFLRGLDAKKT